MELDRRADTIFPLLQSLRDQKYAELQVVVIVKQTAGSRANTQLRAYNRSKIKPKLNMRVIRYKKGMSREIVASRYATGELVLWLTPNMRLSKDFFETASIRFLDYSTEALSLRRQIKLDQTLKNGFQAIDAVWRDYASIIQKPQRQLRYTQTGVIYRRNSSINFPSIRHASSLSIMQAPPVRVTPYGAIASTLSLTAVLTVGLTMGLEYAQYIFVFAVIGHTLLSAIWLINSQLYSIPNKLTLIALAPFQIVALPILASRDAIWRKLPSIAKLRSIHP